MSRTKPIPVKLSIELIERLDNAAAVTGLNNRSSLIRLCLQSFLDYFDKYGEAALPLNWREVLDAMDGRRTRHQATLLKAAEERSDYNTDV